MITNIMELILTTEEYSTRRICEIFTLLMRILKFGRNFKNLQLLSSQAKSSYGSPTKNWEYPHGPQKVFLISLRIILLGGMLE